LRGEDIVVVWGEQLTLGARASNAARALLNVAGRLNLAGREGAGLLEVPQAANGRGLREVVAPGEPAESPSVVYLLHTEGPAAMQEQANTVIAHAAFLTDDIREHATVVFPAESYAEKDGTVTHPDGRIQRLRPAIGLQNSNRYGWQVIAELAARLGADQRVLTSGMAWQQLTAAIPAYAGITLDEIGGRGVRWPERNPDALGDVDLGPFGVDAPAFAPSPNGVLRLGTYRSIWDAPEVTASPALKYVHHDVKVELSPADAQRLNVFHGEKVLVASNGDTAEATVALRDAVPAGSAFLGDRGLHGPTAEIRKIG
jgi:NADH-quinone oxidoreductase subunit G